MTEDLHVVENVLPPHVFQWAFEEFTPTYNFHSGAKYESQIIPPHLEQYYPTWSALEKPDEDGLGDNLQLIRVATYVKLTAQKLLQKDLELFRVNTNIQKFGEEATFHDDGPEGTWTFLVYVMPFWNLEWGGDFIIQSSERDYRSVPCFPNRGILFKGHLQHRGSAPNRLCNFVRLSIAFSFKEIS